MSGAPYWRAARPSMGEDIDMALHMSLSAIAYHGQTNHEHTAKDECLPQKHYECAHHMILRPDEHRGQDAQ